MSRALAARSRSLMALLAATGAAAASAAPPGDERVDLVEVTHVSPDPCCGSGVIAFAVEVSGRTADGPRTYYIFFASPGQVRPDVGRTCRIGWRSFAFSVVLGGTQASNVRGGRGVTRFNCGDGPWTETPPAFGHARR